LVIEAGEELTVQAGGSFIKLDASGVTVIGAMAKANAGGAAGVGTVIGLLPAVLPVAVDMARAGDLLGTAIKQEHYDEQLRVVTSTGAPVKGLKVAVTIPGVAAPQIMETDADGRLPRIKTDAPADVQVHLAWDKITVPEGADDYERSRNK
jgi:type VI secretion system secreted protein VgrG